MAEASPELGGGRMGCPFCRHPMSAVKDSRPLDDGASIRRRRQCLGCGGRFTTYERVHLRDLTVIKRSGRRAAFDREKLERSLRLAMTKRPDAVMKVDHLTARIVRHLETLGDSDVSSALIGDVAMDHLQAADDVAFIRYASVYKDFSTAADFAELLGSAIFY